LRLNLFLLILDLNELSKKCLDECGSSHEPNSGTRPKTRLERHTHPRTNTIIKIKK